MLVKVKTVAAVGTDAIHGKEEYINMDFLVAVDAFAMPIRYVKPVDENDGDAGQDGASSEKGRHYQIRLSHGGDRGPRNIMQVEKTEGKTVASRRVLLITRGSYWKVKAWIAYGRWKGIVAGVGLALYGLYAQGLLQSAWGCIRDLAG